MMLQAVESPLGAWGLLITIVGAMLAAGLVVWTRERPLVAPGRVMHETRIVRVDLVNRDRAVEQELRDAAKSRVPRVYSANAEVIGEIVQSLESLPAAVASAETLDRVDPAIQQKFGLTAELLAAVRGAPSEGEGSWATGITRLGSNLFRRPVLEERSFQRALTEGLNVEIKLLLPASSVTTVPRAEVVNISGGATRDEAMRGIVKSAGLRGALADVAANRLLNEPRPTFRYDEEATEADLAKAANSIATQTVRYAKGQVIFVRGDTLTPAQYDLYQAERWQFPELASPGQVWWPRAGLAAVTAAIAAACAGYTALFVPRIRRSAGRQISAGALLIIALAAACIGTILYPGLASVTATAPIIIVAMLLTVAYEQRVALAYGILLGTLVCLALDRSVGDFAVLVSGIATAVWLLRDVRERGTMVRGALGAGAALAVTTLVVGLVERPVPEAWTQTVVDAALAGAGAVLCGGIVLFVLPTVERLFDVATGLTLIELRDPKQPLLRELQQRAPGTYNHSLNVAAIAEAAADAVGANSLLTYVGGLYHDIGKMNKPEYFIENRVGGGNRHDKLSPALSLLVIVGHVKDGLELAIEFGVPKVLRHFIEAHHGTTLVEYFFHRAKQKAKAAAAQEDSEIGDLEREEDDSELDGMPDEVEYRYPGPRPQTKEVAILMVSDAVESATRTLEDPTPARIETLVRDLANKRLLDGQFDDCELTLRELNQICESIARTVTSIYHGRVAYPSEKRA
jgi:putative nucleotidyltransferase with HDIG domain